MIVLEKKYFIVIAVFLILHSCYYTPDPDYTEIYNKTKDTLILNPIYHNRMELIWYSKEKSPIYSVWRNSIPIADSCLSTFIDTNYLPMNVYYYEILDYNQKLIAKGNSKSFYPQNLQWNINYKMIKKDTCLFLYNKPNNFSPTQYLVSIGSIIYPSITNGQISIFIKNVNEKMFFDLYAYKGGDLIIYKSDTLKLFESPRRQKEIKNAFICKATGNIYTISSNNSNSVMEYKLINDKNFDFYQNPQPYKMPTDDLEKILYVTKDLTIFYTVKNDFTKIHGYKIKENSPFDIRFYCDSIINCSDSIVTLLKKNKFISFNYISVIGDSILKPKDEINSIKVITHNDNSIIFIQDAKTYLYNINNENKELIFPFAIDQGVFCDQSSFICSKSDKLYFPNGGISTCENEKLRKLIVSSSGDNLFIFLDNCIDILEIKTQKQILGIEKYNFIDFNKLIDACSIEDKLIISYSDKIIALPSIN